MGVEFNVRWLYDSLKWQPYRGRDVWQLPTGNTEKIPQSARIETIRSIINTPAYFDWRLDRPEFIESYPLRALTDNVQNLLQLDQTVLCDLDASDIYELICQAIGHDLISWDASNREETFQLLQTLIVQFESQMKTEIRRTRILECLPEDSCCLLHSFESYSH